MASRHAEAVPTPGVWSGLQGCVSAWQAMVPPVLQPEGCTWAGNPNLACFDADRAGWALLHGNPAPAHDQPLAEPFFPLHQIRPGVLDCTSSLQMDQLITCCVEPHDFAIMHVPGPRMAGTQGSCNQHTIYDDDWLDSTPFSELINFPDVKHCTHNAHAGLLDSASSLDGWGKCQESQKGGCQPVASPLFNLGEMQPQDGPAAHQEPQRSLGHFEPSHVAMDVPQHDRDPQDSVATPVSRRRRRRSGTTHRTAVLAQPMYTSPLGSRQQISIKINTSHLVTDLPVDTADRLQMAMAQCHNVRLNGPSHSRLVTGIAVRPGCVRIVLETSRLPRGARPVSTQAPSTAMAPPDGSTWDSCSSEAAAASAEFEQLAAEVVASLGLDPAQLSHMDHVDIQVDGVLVRATWDAILGQWRSTCLPLHTTPGLLGYAVQAKFIGEPKPYMPEPDAPGTQQDTDAHRTHALQFQCQVELPQGLLVVGYTPADGSKEVGAPSNAVPTDTARDGPVPCCSLEQQPVQPAVATHGHESLGDKEVQVLVQLQGSYVATHVTQVGDSIPTDAGASSGTEQVVDLLVGVSMPSPSTPTSSHTKPMWCKLELWASGLLLDWCIVALDDAMLDPAARLPGHDDEIVPAGRLQPMSQPHLRDAAPAAGTAELSAGVARTRRHSKLSDVVSWLSAPRPIADLAARRAPAAAACPDHILATPVSLSHVYLASSDGAEQENSEETNANAAAGASTATTSPLIAPTAPATTTSEVSSSTHGRKDAQLRVRKAWRAQLASAADVADSEDEAQRAGRAAFMADLATWQSMLEDAEAQIFMEAVAAAGGSSPGSDAEPVLALDGRAGSPLRLSLSPALVRYAAVLVRALLRHAVQCGMRSVASQLVAGIRSPAGQRLLAAATRPEELTPPQDQWDDDPATMAASAAAATASTATPATGGWWPLAELSEGFLLLQLASTSGTPGMVEDVKSWLALGRWVGQDGDSATPALDGSIAQMPGTSLVSAHGNVHGHSTMSRLGFRNSAHATGSSAGRHWTPSAWWGMLCVLCLASVLWLLSAVFATSVSVATLVCVLGLGLGGVGMAMSTGQQEQGLWLAAAVVAVAVVGGGYHLQGTEELIAEPWVEAVLGAGEWTLARGLDLAALPPALALMAQVHSPIMAALSPAVASAYMVLLHACALPPVDCMLRSLAVTSLALMYARALGSRASSSGHTVPQTSS